MSRFQIDQKVFTRSGVQGWVDLIEDGMVFITASNGVEMDFQESDLLTEDEYTAFKDEQMKVVSSNMRVRDLGPSNVTQATIEAFFGIPDKKADKRVMVRFTEMAAAFATAELVLDFAAANMAECIAREQGMEDGTYRVDYDKAREAFNGLDDTTKVKLIAASLKVPVIVLHGCVDVPGTEMLRQVVGRAMILNGGDLVLFKARRDIQRYESAIPS